MKYKIFIVEDDAIIASTVEKSIKSWGFDAACAVKFDEIISEFVKYEPHLVLLDISLPFFNGYHWCKEIRKISNVPIVFISSASDDVNIVMAMNMGADDFITKPFELSVLVAKINALLRRTYDMTYSSSLIEVRGAVLNSADDTLTYDSFKTELTKNEFKILKLLMENKGRIINRDDIIVKLWEADDFVDENTLTVNITRIRKKLDEIGLKDFIKTKRGIGYIVE